MKIKCVAIDDEPLALELIRKYVSNFQELEVVATFDDPLEGIAYLRDNKIDLLFIDINMPHLTGLELVGKLEEKPLVIFTTAHKNFAVEGFELEALDYLLKPISPERFEKSIQRAIEQYAFRNKQPEDTGTALFVRSEYKLVKINLRDILYIEGMEDYIKIHLLATLHPILTLMSLKEVFTKLPVDEFSRIHRSYIVANSQVHSVLNKKVYLTNQKELPVSDSYLDFISKWKAK